jgi:hypothetical protein
VVLHVFNNEVTLSRSLNNIITPSNEVTMTRNEVERKTKLD